ncbi:MAG: pitrilysin family protein [Deltaproteobacteria bacterium]|nr:pitrilysin family protein [Deltaproteobacteria bacterium]
MINKTVLDNGISVISEDISHVRSVSIGMWVRCGSCHEDAHTNGTAHFIEHMLFKGTEKRSAFDIAWAIDSVGGVMNAFTGKELTSFYLKIPDYHFPLAIDIMSDIFNNSCFAEAEIAREKSVILQEISMVEDSPDEYIHELFDALFWGRHPLGLPILGTKERVGAMNRTSLAHFFNSRYRGDKLILTAAGNLKHEELVEMATAAFGALSGDVTEKEVVAPVVAARTSVLEKDLEQVHLVIGVPAPSAVSPQRHAGMLLNAILGGSMSSWLFQEVREKRGLAYEIQSYLTSYTKEGLLGVYVGTDAEKIPEVMNIILDAFRRFKDRPLEENELRAVKEMLKGNFLLSMESTDNRMSRLARNEVYFQRHVPAEEVTANIDAVTSAEVRDLAAELFDPAVLSVAAIGRIKERDITGYLT